MITKVYVEITNICNLDCSFCHKTKREKKVMTEEQFNFISEHMRKYAKYLFFHLMGEPTNHPLLCSFIKKANDLGYKTVLTTNGTLLDKKGAEIIEAKPHRINVSLHSYEANCNNPHGSLEQYVSSCLEFGKRCSENKILCIFRLWNRGGLESENNSILDMIKKNFKEPWNKTAKGYRIADYLFLEWDDCFEWPDVNNSICNPDRYCLGVKDQIGILVDGTVVPCCLDSEGTVALGNIFTTSFEEIYSNDRCKKIAKGFEKRLAVEDLCKHCGYSQRF